MKDLDQCHENQKKNTQKSKQQQKPTLVSSLWSCCAIYGHTGEKYISLDGLSLSCSCLQCCKSWPVEFLKEREKPFHVDHFPKTFTWRSVLNSAVALTKVSACSATPISRPQAFFFSRVLQAHKDNGEAQLCNRSSRTLLQKELKGQKKPSYLQ